MEAVAVVLFDLDGVIRLWNEAVTDDIEQAAGLPRGIIERLAFEPETLRMLTTGKTTKDAWLSALASDIGNPSAIAEWAARRTWVDPEVMALVRRVSATKKVGLATNGTDTLQGELDALGIGAEFETIFNSAEIGAAKPDPCFYLNVVEALDIEPGQIGYVDDRSENVNGARAIGIRASDYTDPQALEVWLHQIGAL
jgi:HAD superfamily hydrolase (TIGR01509 family)